MRIAEVADRSGFPAATLRYYEQVGLLPAPDRTAAGYRAYDEAVLARLAFIGRAKSLGCSLEEISALMPDWAGGRCEPVQGQLRELVATKLGDAQARVTELVAFASDLQGILATLGTHTPDGPCDEDCGCVGDLAPPSAAAPAPVVACSLDVDELPGRIHDWQALLVHVARREAVDGGVRLVLGPGTPLDEFARLIRAEQACCDFFAFALTVDGRGTALEVRAPSEAGPVVASLFGRPTTGGGSGA